MAKKSELEAHSAEYRRLMSAAHRAEGRGMYREAVVAAVAAWEHVDGMMQYERRYEEKAAADVSAIDLALRYAPLLLDFRRLDELERLLTDYKRIQKNAPADVRKQLALARSQMWENHRLWTYLEQNPGAEQNRLRQAMGGDQDYWRTVVMAWERMGLIERTAEAGTYRLSLATRMGQVVQGKCPRCGHVEEAPKAMFLEEMSCPHCRGRVVFVLLAAADADRDRESDAGPGSGEFELRG